MAKTTLGQMKAEETTPAKAEVAVSPTPPKDEIVLDSNEGMEGDWGTEDLMLPRINVVAKTSELVDEGFTPGSIVFNKELELVAKDIPLNVIVINMIKKYQEDIDWDDDAQAKVFHSKSEMHAAGYSTDYGSENYCKPFAKFTLLIRRPENVEDEAGMFPHEFEGKSYAMAEFIAAKTAYKTTAVTVASAVAFSNNALWNYQWSLSATLKSFKDNTWFSPTMKRAGLLSETEMGFVRGILPN